MQHAARPQGELDADTRSAVQATYTERANCHAQRVHAKLGDLNRRRGQAELMRLFSPKRGLAVEAGFVRVVGREVGAVAVPHVLPL